MSGSAGSVCVEWPSRFGVCACGPSTSSIEHCRGDAPRGYRIQCQLVAELLHKCNEIAWHAIRMKSLKCLPRMGSCPTRLCGPCTRVLEWNLILMGPGNAPVVRRHMTLDVAGVARLLVSTSRHSEQTEGRCQVLVTNATINCCRTYEDCDPKTAS